MKGKNQLNVHDMTHVKQHQLIEAEIEILKKQNKCLSDMFMFLHSAIEFELTIKETQAFAAMHEQYCKDISELESKYNINKLRGG